MKLTSKDDDTRLLPESWRRRLGQLVQTLTVEQLDANGLLPIVDCAGELASAALQQAARQARQQLLARELLNRELVQKIGKRLQQASVPAIVLKGEALAHRYPALALRPRHDIDLWVAEAQRGLAETELRALGGEPVPTACGRWIQPEQLWRLPAGRSWIGIDLHWQPTSRPALLATLPFARCLAEGQPMPDGHGLRMLGDVDALLLACIHRLAHHRHEPERLIWQLDIALLWDALDFHERERACSRAVSTGVGCLLADGLLQAAGWLQESPAKALLQLAPCRTREPARVLLQRDPVVADWRFDLAQARGRQRWQVLRDYTLPSAEFMRHRFAHARWRWLPWLYLRRLLGV